MKTPLVSGSLFLLVLSILFLAALTVFESALVGVSSAIERTITFLLLVLPAAAGAVLGVLSLARKEGQVWLATLSAVLNAFFALFHSVVLLFAG